MSEKIQKQLSGYGLLVLLFSIVPQLSQAQIKAEFVSGYYVTLSKDTIKADIYFEDWVISPSQIKVKTPGEQKTLTTDDVLGFGIKTKTLEVDFTPVRMGIKYIQYPDEVVDFGKSPYSEIGETSFFAKNLIIGEHGSLFRMVDKFEKERFIFGKNGFNTELEYFTYLTQKKGSGGQTFQLVYDNYKSQLESLCSDAPKMKNKTAKYNEQSLKDYILEYNRCFLGDITEVQKTEKATYNLITGLGYEKTYEYLTDKGDGKKSFGHTVFLPRVELGLRINFPYNFRNNYVEIDYNIMALVIKGKQAKRGINLTYGGFFKSKNNIQLGYATGITEGKNIFIGSGLAYKKKIHLDIKYGIYPVKGTLSGVLKYAIGK
jgi:hypothetical protein